MKIEIPDEWLKKIWDMSPDTPIADAVKIYFSNREHSNNKMIIFAIGERALHEIGLYDEKS